MHYHGRKDGRSIAGLQGPEKKSCRPVDVLLVTGLNDINNNRTAEEIFQAYMRLKAMVLEVMPETPDRTEHFCNRITSAPTNFLLLWG